MATETNQEQQGPEFAVQRIYQKDLSVESPKAPQIFLQSWEPAIEIDLKTGSTQLDEDNYDIQLRVTMTAKVNDEVALIIEVEQAGIFVLKGFDNDQMRQMCGSFCPNILYPYARQVISNCAVDAGFPPVYLAPVNFDALLAERDAAANAEAVGDTESA